MGLGDVGRALRTPHRPTAALGHRAGGVHGRGCGLLLVAFGSDAIDVLRLGVATGLARDDGLDGRAGPPAVRVAAHDGGCLYPVFAVMASCLGDRGPTKPCRSTWTQRRTPMAGQLIDVGGHRLHLQCAGSGSPTVVLQARGRRQSSGHGVDAPGGRRSTPACVSTTPAGRGWSDPSDATPGRRADG